MPCSNTDFSMCVCVGVYVCVWVWVWVWLGLQNITNGNITNNVTNGEIYSHMLGLSSSAWRLMAPLGIYQACSSEEELKTSQGENLLAHRVRKTKRGRILWIET